MHPLSNDFMSLFDGFKEAHGIFNANVAGKSGDKVVGKAATITKPVTQELWNLHLEGKQGLGIIPINANSLCKFGAIDIDEYDLDLLSLNRNIQQYKFPVMVCRTKSGGAHLYMFMREFIEAKLIIQKLKEVASFLGYGTCEIYPRQAQLLVDRGDAGNWINMPYFDAGHTMRYALDENSKSMDAVKFLERAHEKSMTREQLLAMMIVVPEALTGGPPCLQHLIRNGFPQGTRNNGLFNLGIYAQKAYPNEWQLKMESFNMQFMKPPLTSVEVLAIMKSIEKKDYTYTCKSQPIQSYCDSVKCRMCTHGIGSSNMGMPKMGSLTKLCTVPPIWFLDVETEDGQQRMELSTEDLQNPIRFQSRCMESLNIMPQIAKRDMWQTMISGLLTSVTRIEIPVDSTPAGQFMQHVEAFCTSRVNAKSEDELLLGKPWTSAKQIYFRMQDIIKYLDRVRFFEFKLNEITMHLRAIKGSHRKFKHIKGKGFNVWVIPEDTFTKQTESFDKIEQDEGVL